MGIFQPKSGLSLHRTHSSLSIPNFFDAPKWKSAMVDEISALHRLNTWSLVSNSPQYNIVVCKWIFQLKKKMPMELFKDTKPISLLRASIKLQGLTYFKTFNLVAKASTIHIVLVVAISHGWSLRELDFNNEFLNKTLKEALYMSQQKIRFLV